MLMFRVRRDERAAYATFTLPFDFDDDFDNIDATLPRLCFRRHDADAPVFHAGFCH